MTDSIVSVHLDINIYDYDNLISKNVVFRDNNIISVGEVIGIDNGIMNAALVGEIRNNKFYLEIFLSLLLKPAAI